MQEVTQLREAARNVWSSNLLRVDGRPAIRLGLCRSPTPAALGLIFYLASASRRALASMRSAVSKPSR